MLLRGRERLGLFSSTTIPPVAPGFSVDYATMYPPPTVASQTATAAMQPMSSSDAGSSGGAGMVLHGSPPSPTHLFTPGPINVDYAPVTVPPVVVPPASGTLPGGLAPSPDNLAQLQAPKLSSLLNPFDPQRSVPLIAGVAGGGALLLVLLLRR